jgi:hypothetical protein
MSAGRSACTPASRTMSRSPGSRSCPIGSDRQMPPSIATSWVTW